MDGDSRELFDTLSEPLRTVLSLSATNWPSCFITSDLVCCKVAADKLIYKEALFGKACLSTIVLIYSSIVFPSIIPNHFYRIAPAPVIAVRLQKYNGLWHWRFRLCCVGRKDSTNRPKSLKLSNRSIIFLQCTFYALFLFLISALVSQDKNFHTKLISKYYRKLKKQIDTDYLIALLEVL